MLEFLEIDPIIQRQTKWRRKIVKGRRYSSK